MIDKGPRVLIVDDDRDVLEIVGDVLRRGGHRLSTSSDVRAAEACLERKRPDVVICDWSLDGQTSEAFLRQVNREYPSIGRVLLTGSLRQEWVHLLAEGVIDVALQKPFELEELGEAISRGRATPKP